MWRELAGISYHEINLIEKGKNHGIEWSTRAGIEVVNKLFAGTQTFADALIAHGVPVVEVEPHDAEDPESSDRIWLMRYSDGGMCEGEYIFVEESRYNDSDQVDLWVGHNSADVCGGHPTYWSTLIPAGDIAAIQALILEQWPKGE